MPFDDRRLGVMPSCRPLDADVGSNVRNGLAIRRLWPVFDPAGSARSVETVRLLGRGAQSRATIGISCPCARCTALYTASSRRSVAGEQTTERDAVARRGHQRSEEHTSDIQSLTRI